MPLYVFPRETCVVHFSLLQRQDNMRGALNPPTSTSTSLFIAPGKCRVNHMQPLRVSLSCAWLGLKSQTHFPSHSFSETHLPTELFLFIYLLHPYNCTLISPPYSLWGYDCPSSPKCPLLPLTTCVPWPFPAHPGPPGLPQGVPQAGRAPLEGGGRYSL